MDDYITIPTWMLRIGLAGNELYAYAIIYQCSMCGLGHYCGGTRYLSEVLGIDEDEAGRIIMKLLNEGYIKTSDAKFAGETSAFQYNPDKEF